MKSQMKKILVLFLTGVTMSACVTTVPMKSGQKIEMKGSSFLTRQYQQEGKNLELSDMFEKLGKQDSIKDKVNKGKYMFYGSMGLAAVGGYLIGYNLVSSSSSRSSDMMTGVLVAGAGFGLAYLAASNMDEAVETYNRGVGGGKKKTGFQFQWSPYAFNDQAGVGLGFRF